MRTLALTLALVATPAIAEFQTGNDLYEGLRANRGTFEFNYAFGYTIGAFDAAVNVHTCPPNGITQGQVLDMTLAYLDNNPNMRHYSADSVISLMFNKMWPCRKGNGV
jgi:hypothetical protein